MANFLQAFGTATNIAFSGTAFSTLNCNAGGGNAVSDMVDNSAALYDEIILEVKASYSQANQSTGYLDLRILASIDNTDWSTWQCPYIVLPSMDMSAGGGSTTAIYHARFVAPQRWKISIKGWINTY